MAASFEEKVEALRRLQEKRQARQCKASAADLTLAPSGASCEKSARVHDDTAVSNGSQAAPSQPDHRMMEPDALFCAGHCCERGLHGCDKDETKAAHLYQLAAEAGHTVAQWRLGELYEYGRGVQKDEAVAAEWYKKAAEAGNMHAQASFALLLEEGRGLPANQSEAFRWHLLAAEAGHTLAQYSIACCYIEGRGAGRDIDEARRWLKCSAVAGFPPAVSLLADVETSGCTAETEDKPSTPTSEASSHGDMARIRNLAERMAEQLQGVDEAEAAMMLDELLAEEGLGDDDDLEDEEAERNGGISLRAVELDHSGNPKETVCDDEPLIRFIPPARS